jgi:ATP-dependent DNA helicase RecQ
VVAAARFFRGQDVLVDPRKIWASGLPGHKGRIGFLAEGRALAFADDPAWAEELDRLWRHDEPAPPEVLAAMVEVLKRWSRSWQRPVAVVPMPSRSYPRLIGSVAEHLARVGRLPLVDALAVTGPAPALDASSATRAGDLLRTTILRPGVAFDGPVLLVDDRIRSRWTVTVAGSLLAEAGATSVLPLALHQLP